MAIYSKVGRLILMCATACTMSCVSAAESSDETSSQTEFYRDVGRIRWTIPAGENFYFAVPEFTVGPRIKCGPKAQADCEIQVSARQLTITADHRKAELLETAKPYYAEAVESKHEIHTYGEDRPVEYIALTHQRDGGKVAIGHFVNGPFVVKFHFLARDPDGSKLERVLRVVRSAEALDGDAYLAFRLSDFKAACEELLPDLSHVNADAFSRSKFAKVDYVEYFTKALPSVTKEEMGSKLLRTRQLTIEAMRKWPKDETANYCGSFPTQIRAAEE